MLSKIILLSLAASSALISAAPLPTKREADIAPNLLIKDVMGTADSDSVLVAKSEDDVQTRSEASLWARADQLKDFPGGPPWARDETSSLACHTTDSHPLVKRSKESLWARAFGLLDRREGEDDIETRSEASLWARDEASLPTHHTTDPNPADKRTEESLWARGSNAYARSDASLCARDEGSLFARRTNDSVSAAKNIKVSLWARTSDLLARDEDTDTKARSEASLWARGVDIKPLAHTGDSMSLAHAD
ncbi:hypothetical protein BAUCODRAFT_160369 [Baudoinia panamericana UAMH 10762]|uniref:Uncharacterized protein n=1 Tax=Baudoinia panamericana (strain UAMH 10762) TaxID=717646 RepID=M2MK34_BAUPA|nr:uncharacterized protein BAUCODRAFT_160369 [Baudoinia panamericana UAMH 10762]EMC91688.1 hypothetical protein BAUCODRAFT_160369 [Baudoinia panamericana UAMH 10762]